MLIDPRFKDDFNLCMEFYEVALDEAKFEKKRVLLDYDAACRCYSIIAAGIRGLDNVK